MAHEPKRMLMVEQIASNIFGFTHALIDCSEYTTLDDFANSILVKDADIDSSDSAMRSRHDNYLDMPAFRSLSRSSLSDSSTENKKIANMIIAKNFDETSKHIQLQALELMRSKHMYSHSTMQTAPKRFLFVVLLGGGQGPRLTKHLNDHMFMSHFHDPEDGYPNCEELDDDGGSVSSVIARKTKERAVAHEPLFPAKVKSCVPVMMLLYLQFAGDGHPHAT